MTAPTPTAPKPKAKKSRLGKAPTQTEVGSATVGNNTQKAGNSDLVPLNFKVDAEFKRDLKSFAVGHDMSMVEVLKQAFELYKTQKGG